MESKKMKGLWIGFKRINAEITLFVSTLPSDYRHNRPYCRLAPFAWMWLLIPIAGMVGMFASFRQAEIDYNSGLRG